jgi:hypothetical protein
MSRRRVSETQLEMFATPVHVESLDPKESVGSATRVDALWRVRIGDGGGTHLIFRDRHGTYCEEHGPRCRAVREVLNAAD